MSSIGTLGLIIIIANCLISYQGFQNNFFFATYIFQVDKILISRDYKRLITGGFLHATWPHLIFNMLSLAAFCGSIEAYLGEIQFIAIYAASLIGGHLFALFIHRNHGNYSAVGASGAICGIIFASIALFPDMGISIFFLPFFIPGWLYGILYVLYSIYGIKSKKENIGHEAHLGGALIGMTLAILMHPASLGTNYFPIILVTIPSIIFIYFIITKPYFLLFNRPFLKSAQLISDRNSHNTEKINKEKKQKEVDTILEKIHKKGIESLSKKEKKILEAHAKGS